MTINSYRDLKVWQLGISLTKQVYLLTRDFPKSETYGLSTKCNGRQYRSHQIWQKVMLEIQHNNSFDF